MGAGARSRLHRSARTERESSPRRMTTPRCVGLRAVPPPRCRAGSDRAGRGRLRTGHPAVAQGASLGQDDRHGARGRRAPRRQPLNRGIPGRPWVRDEVNRDTVERSSPRGDRRMETRMIGQSGGGSAPRRYPAGDREEIWTRPLGAVAMRRKSGILHDLASGFAPVHSRCRRINLSPCGTEIYGRLAQLASAPQ